MTKNVKNQTTTMIKSNKLRDNTLFRNSFISTILTVLACLSTHIITLLGLAGAVAWLGEAEHILLFLSIGLVGLTIYAYFRHRKSCLTCP